MEEERQCFFKSREDLKGQFPWSTMITGHFGRRKSCFHLKKDNPFHDASLPSRGGSARRFNKVFLTKTGKLVKLLFLGLNVNKIQSRVDGKEGNEGGPDSCFVQELSVTGRPVLRGQIKVVKTYRQARILWVLRHLFVYYLGIICRYKILVYTKVKEEISGD